MNIVRNHKGGFRGYDNRDYLDNEIARSDKNRPFNRYQSIPEEKYRAAPRLVAAPLEAFHRQLLLTRSEQAEVANCLLEGAVCSVHLILGALFNSSKLIAPDHGQTVLRVQGKFKALIVWLLFPSEASPLPITPVSAITLVRISLDKRYVIACAPRDFGSSEHVAGIRETPTEASNARRSGELRAVRTASSDAL